MSGGVGGKSSGDGSVNVEGETGLVSQAHVHTPSDRTRSTFGIDLVMTRRMAGPASSVTYAGRMAMPPRKNAKQRTLLAIVATDDTFARATAGDREVWVQIRS